ncbi:hypothetical protein H1164_03830 [Thermoactinomyces daqus]|uniref:Uncharacterized protein n=1 Tax=Thermoactinomyces daqus TaxID=1329516 RepID=A0A7W1X8H4_9BACL|nr:hypothetical protein [Thermoactinomyces daqus]MBA4542031.1 hypothetical protein [Thermoactinomyces daqus]
MASFSFDKDNHREQFAKAVTRLVTDDYPYAEKIAKIEALTEAYVLQTGKRPDPRELDELASWLIFGTKGLSLRKKNEIKAMRDKC